MHGKEKGHTVGPQNSDCIQMQAMQNPRLSNCLLLGVSPRERGENIKLKKSDYFQICILDKVQHAYK
jgi:hypothetical protein